MPNKVEGSSAGSSQPAYIALPIKNFWMESDPSGECVVLDPGGGASHIKVDSGPFRKALKRLMEGPDAWGTLQAPPEKMSPQLVLYVPIAPALTAHLGCQPRSWKPEQDKPVHVPLPQV